MQLNVRALSGLYLRYGKAMASDGVPELLQKADDLYGQQKYKEALDELEPLSADSEDTELLWRVLRLYYRLGKAANDDKATAESFAKKAYEISQKGLTINENSFGIQKWSGIITSWYSDFAGLQFKVQSSAEIRKHFEKAIELDPKEPFVKYLLGRWCFQVASLPWLKRKAASVLGTLPTSSYEEAISFFEACNAATSKPFTPNWLYLGKCYMQQRQWSEAKKWFSKVLEEEGNQSDPDHKEAVEEAKTLIKKV